MKFIFNLYRASSKSKVVPKQDKLILNSNDRMHFHQKAKIVEQLKLRAKNAVVKSAVGIYDHKWRLVQPIFTPDNICGVTLTVYTPTKRRSDPDNLQPTLKALMDGFTESRLWTDDNHEVVKFTKYQFGGLSGHNGYRLEVDVEEL